MSSYLVDKEKLWNTVFMVSLVAIGIYLAKTVARIVGRFIKVSSSTKHYKSSFLLPCAKMHEM